MIRILLLVSVLMTFASAQTATTRALIFKQLGAYPNSYQTWPSGLNIYSQFAGYYLPFAANARGYIQTGSTFLTVQPANSTISYLAGINDFGIAIGGFCDTLDCNTFSAQHGFIYDIHTKVYTTLDYPTPGYSVAAFGINNLGQIVGGYCPGTECSNNGPSSFGFVWSNGVYSTISVPSATATQANSINDSGIVVGYYYAGSFAPYTGFIYKNGIFTDLKYPGANWTIAWGINNAGTISGSFQDANYIVHGFIYAKGAYTQVDAPQSFSTSLAGISNSGRIAAEVTSPQIGNVVRPFVVIPHK